MLRISKDLKLTNSKPKHPPRGAQLLYTVVVDILKDLRGIEKTEESERTEGFSELQSPKITGQGLK